MAIEAKCIRCGEKQANNMAVSATVVWPDKRRDNPSNQGGKQQYPVQDLKENQVIETQ